MADKLKGRAELVRVLSDHRTRGERIVFTNGCFDLLHIGHVRYLQTARRLGELLVVGVNSDASVRTLEKGPGRPIVPDRQRAEVLAALACVDSILTFDDANAASLIGDVLADVLVKGGDWSPDLVVGRDMVEARRGIVRTISLVPDVSTTCIVERIKRLPH